MEDPEVGTYPGRLDSRTVARLRANVTRVVSRPDLGGQLSSVSPNLQNNKVIRIVIAHDEHIFRESLQLLLQMRDDFEVIGGCSDAKSSLDMLLELKPDVLLLDYNLWGEGEMNVLRHLRELDANIKVILLCPAISQEETVRALRSGARGILPKTEPTESLIDCIHRVAQSGYWLGSDGLRDVVNALCTAGNSRSSVKNSFKLTQREIEIIHTVLQGFSNPEIAAKFSLSEQTIKHHLSHIFDKLGVYSRVELALFAVNHDINSE